MGWELSRHHCGRQNMNFFSLSFFATDGLYNRVSRKALHYIKGTHSIDLLQHLATIGNKNHIYCDHNKIIAGSNFSNQQSNNSDATFQFVLISIQFDQLLILSNYLTISTVPFINSKVYSQKIPKSFLKFIIL